MKNENCKNCKFWISYKGTGFDGYCRRYAPQVIASVSGGGAATVIGISTDAKTVWPETSYDDWCGEYQPEPEKKPE